MKSTLKRSVAVAAALSAASALGPPIAGADEAAAVHTLGGQAELVNGNVVQGWTIRDLKPSADAIPHSAAGTVWEATASDTAIQGTVIPVVSNLNARARDGETYPVLFGVATPQGVNPATLGQGQTTSGKVYFDVTGAAPDSVTYSAGGNDLIVWVQPPPATAATGPGSPQGRHPAPAPLVGPTPAPGPSTAPAGNAAPAAVGQGAPIPAPGTAAPGSVGTPLQAGAPDAPLPTGAATPAPATGTGSVGTPLQQADTQGATLGPLTPPTPITSAAPQPAGVTGQPVSSGTQLPADGQRTTVSVPTTTVAPSP
ncbi:MAG: hypothetical protein QOE94_828 [Mycobacterium sp.]|nr:hypothetical protein [Mycobacterium sp.]